MPATDINGANRLIPLSNEYRCACGETFHKTVYRTHRIYCDAWQEASKRQQEIYHELCQERQGKKRREWTKTMSLILGVAYYRTHGQMPHPHKMKSIWYMPEAKAVYVFFGDLHGYHAAIEQACVSHTD